MIILKMLNPSLSEDEPCTANLTPFPRSLFSSSPNPSPLRSWLLLFLLPQRRQTNTRDLDDLESHTGNITLCLPLTTKTSEEDLVVLVYEVETTVIWHCGNASLAFAPLHRQYHPHQSRI
jgi:hypothetical protein